MDLDGTLHTIWKRKLKFSCQNGPSATAISAGSPLEVPYLPLGLSLPLRWPKGHILTPTCAKFVLNCLKSYIFTLTCTKFVPQLTQNLTLKAWPWSSKGWGLQRGICSRPFIKQLFKRFEQVPPILDNKCMLTLFQEAQLLECSAKVV
jgi:hypothetical protein